MADDYSIGAEANTYVSTPGNPGGAPSSTAPGASSVGSSLPVHHAVIYVIGGAAVALLAIGYIFRRPVGSA